MVNSKTGVKEFHSEFFGDNEKSFVKDQAGGLGLTGLSIAWKG